MMKRRLFSPARTRLRRNPPPVYTARGTVEGLTTHKSGRPSERDAFYAEGIAAARQIQQILSSPPERTDYPGKELAAWSDKLEEAYGGSINKLRWARDRLVRLVEQLEEGLFLPRATRLGSKPSMPYAQPAPVGVLRLGVDSQGREAEFARRAGTPAQRADVVAQGEQFVARIEAALKAIKRTDYPKAAYHQFVAKARGAQNEGIDKLIFYYSKLKGLADQLDHGMFVATTRKKPKGKHGIPGHIPEKDRRQSVNEPGVRVRTQDPELRSALRRAPTKNLVGRDEVLEFLSRTIDLNEPMGMDAPIAKARRALYEATTHLDAEGDQGPLIGGVIARLLKSLLSVENGLEGDFTDDGLDYAHALMQMGLGTLLNALMQVPANEVSNVAARWNDLAIKRKDSRTAELHVARGRVAPRPKRDAEPFVPVDAPFESWSEMSRDEVSDDAEPVRDTDDIDADDLIL